MPSHFKGWAIPGPDAPGASAPAGHGAPEEGETLDALSGHYRIYQLKDGHRFSTDDLLTAWYGTVCVPCARAVLDLGSGIGSVGMTAAWRLQGARFTTIEAQEISVRLARKSAAYNGLSARYEIRQGDLRDPAVLGAEERFDLVLGSPPYFPLDSGLLGDHPQKVACRFEVRGAIGDYCATAARALSVGGVFACVFPVEPGHQLERVRAAAAATGLVVFRRRPVALKEGEPPLLGLFAMMRAEDLPSPMRGAEWVEPPLVIRLADGRVSPEYSAVKLSIGFPP